MHQTRKGNRWYFGAKTHIDVDSKEGIVLSMCTSARVRSKAEWPFRILKRIFGYPKVRYRGLKKNHEWLLAAFALVNLYQHRKRLVPPGA